jgi:taurine dioxygenase
LATPPEDLARWEADPQKEPAAVAPGDPHAPGERAQVAVCQRRLHHARSTSWKPAESEAILKLLFAHATRPEFTMRWRWQENDVAFWDNRVTQHYAVDDYRPQRRVMHRATILGDVPF